MSDPIREAVSPSEGIGEPVETQLHKMADRVAAEIMGNDHLRHRLDEQQAEEVHGDIQSVVLGALRWVPLALSPKGEPPAPAPGFAEGAVRNLLDIHAALSAAWTADYRMIDASEYEGWRSKILAAATALDRAQRVLAHPAPSAGLEDGWQLVPKEPTPEMLGVWYRYKSGYRSPGEPEATDTSDYGAYRAMLAAAPPAAAEGS